MEIKEFINETLVQIVEGVVEANKKLITKGACIPTENVGARDGFFDVSPHKRDEPIKRYIKVDFDIAVEALSDGISKIEGTAEVDGAIKLQVALISKAEVNGKGSISVSDTQQNMQQNIHHVKFSLPLSLPTPSM